MLAGFAGDMAFGKTGDADAEIALLADKPDQLAGVLEAAWRGFKLASAGRVAAQSQHVLDTQLLDLVPANPGSARELNKRRSNAPPQ